MQSYDQKVMGIVLYSPTFRTDDSDDYWDAPTIYIMTMDDYRYWRNNNQQCKNVVCFLPINVHLALAYRQYYVQNFTMVKPEQGKTKKAPTFTLVCDPLTDIETFYLVNYYGNKIPQYSNKTVLEFVANIHKARYYLAQNCLNKPSGKMKTMYNIADLYDSRFLQNELELPLDRNQAFNIYFANNRIRQEIVDELECFQSEVFIASHGESVGRFFHITDAPKQTTSRLNTQTRLNLVEHNFSTTVRGTFVNLPINFRNRFVIPDSGHLGHKNIQPEKPKPPSFVLNSSILDITSPNRPKPVYEIHTKTKKLDIKDTFKSNFEPLKKNDSTRITPKKNSNPGPSNKQSLTPTKLTVPTKKEAQTQKISAKAKENIPPKDHSGSSQKFSPPSPKKTPLGSNKSDATLDQSNKSAKSSDESLTLEFTTSSESKSPVLDKSNIKSKDSPKPVLGNDTPNRHRTEFLNELLRPIPEKEKSSDSNSNATTYSDIFRTDQIVFDLSRPNNPSSTVNTVGYDSMHELSESLKRIQIDFRGQLNQLLEDYQKVLAKPNNSIVPDPALNVSFLNDINQLIRAIQNNENTAQDIRQHVLETITNIVNKHFHNPSGPLNPDKINLDHVNPRNYVQRSAIAYLDNIRDNIIQIKPPLTETNSLTPLADQNIAKIANDFYESIEPLVKCIFEQFNEAKDAIEKTVTETNHGLSKALAPTVPQSNPKPKPKPNLALQTRKSPRLANQKNLDKTVIVSSSDSDDVPHNKPPMNKLTSTVQKDKKPRTTKSLPNTPTSKNKVKFATKSERATRASKVRFKLNQEQKSPVKTPRKVIPQVSDTLYNLCDPSPPKLTDMQTGEELENEPNRKRTSSDIREPPNKKKKQEKGKYVITDSDEEV